MVLTYHRALKTHSHVSLDLFARSKARSECAVCLSLFSQRARVHTPRPWKIRSRHNSMPRQHSTRNMRPILLLCMLISPAGLLISVGPKAAVAADAAAADATAEPISAPITQDAFREAITEFASRLENAYDLSGRFGVDIAQLQQIRVPQQYIKAAEEMRKNFRQRLWNATDGSFLANLTASGKKNVVDSLLKSSTPMVLAQDGTPMLPELQSFALFLGQKLQELVQEAAAGVLTEALSGLGTGKVAESLAGAAVGNTAEMLSKLGSGKVAESLADTAGSSMAETIAQLMKDGSLAKLLAGADASKVAETLSKLTSENIAELLKSVADSSTADMSAELGSGNIAELLASAAGSNMADMLSNLGSGNIAEAMPGAASGSMAEILSNLGSGTVAEALAGTAGSNIADMLSKLGSGEIAQTVAGAAGSNIAELLAGADAAKLAEALSKLASGNMAESLTELLPNVAGRKLMDVNAAEADKDMDAVAAAVHDIERVKGYLFSLAEMADEVFSAEKAWNEANGATSEDSGEVLQASHRRLQQADNPFDSYATAFRFVFSTLIDFFRANGLYGLVPLIADVRGIFNRWNWIGDLLQLVSTPVENFVNANYFPLPQSNADAIKLGQKLLADFCKFEKAEDSEHVLGEYTGPKFTVELKPVSCPIYKDKLYGRSYISFADCEAAKLVISVTPLEISGPHHTAATYTSNECKYTETYGIDMSFGLGGGEGAFTFTRSAQGIDVVPTVIQVSPNLEFTGYRLPAPGGADVGPTGGPGIQVTTSATVTDPPRAVTTTGPTVQRVNLTDSA